MKSRKNNLNGSLIGIDGWMDETYFRVHILSSFWGGQ